MSVSPVPYGAGPGIDDGAFLEDRTTRPRAAGDGVLVEQQISSLQEQTDILTKRIEVERRKGEELDKKIRISNGKLTETRTKLRGVDDTSEAKARAKAMRSAEHRLDIIMGRLNQMSKTNDMHRTEIESLRLDKLQRQRILRRLERDLTETRARVARKREDAQGMTAARDKAQRDIAALQATLAQEQELFEAELQATMDVVSSAAAARRQQRNLRDANGGHRRSISMDATAAGGGRPVSAISRPMSPGAPEVDPAAEAAAALAAAGGPGSPGGTQQGGLSTEQEAALKHRSTKNWWEIAQREVDVREQGRKLAALEDAFGKIQEETGIGSIEEMVSAFVSTEDRNYSVLTMINDLNREIEAAEVENAGLRASVEHARSQGSAGQASRDSLYRDWEALVEGLGRRGAQYDRLYEAALRMLDTVKPGVQSIFLKLGCANASLAEQLAAAGITDSNLMLHLGLIEARIDELVHLADMASSGIPLSLPLDDDEVSATIAPPLPVTAAPSSSNASGKAAPGALAAASAAAALSQAPPGLVTPALLASAAAKGGVVCVSPRVAVEISRVGGQGSRGGARAVLAAPIAPSVDDLEDSESEEGGNPPAAAASPVKGGAAGGRGGRGLGDTAGSKGATQRSAAAALAAAAAAASDALAAPMDLEDLRAHTIALVERKQAKAELLRERAAAEAAAAAAAAVSRGGGGGDGLLFDDGRSVSGFGVRFGTAASGAVGGRPLSGVAGSTVAGHDGSLSPSPGGSRINTPTVRMRGTSVASSPSTAAGGPPDSPGGGGGGSVGGAAASRARTLSTLSAAQSAAVGGGALVPRPPAQAPGGRPARRA